MPERFTPSAIPQHSPPPGYPLHEYNTEPSMPLPVTTDWSIHTHIGWPNLAGLPRHIPSRILEQTDVEPLFLMCHSMALNAAAGFTRTTPPLTSPVPTEQEKKLQSLIATLYMDCISFAQYIRGFTNTIAALKYTLERTLNFLPNCIVDENSPHFNASTNLFARDDQDIANYYNPSYLLNTSRSSGMSIEQIILKRLLSLRDDINRDGYDLWIESRLKSCESAIPYITDAYGITIQVIAMKLPQILEELLKHSRDKQEAILNDPLSLIHQALMYAWLTWLIQEPQPKTLQDFNQRQNEFLKTISTKLREPVIFARLDHITFKRGRQQVFSNIEGLSIWLPEAQVQRLKDTKRIRWCSVTKRWMHADFFTRVWMKKPNAPNQYTRKLIALFAPELKVYKQCPTCKNYWKDVRFIIDWRISYKNNTTVCPKCRGLDNKPAMKHVGSYHGSRNQWVFYYQKTAKERKDTLTMGVECEMQVTKNNLTPTQAIANILDAQVILNSKWNNIFFERDGSLDSNGIEMISNPMSLKYHQHYWTKMLPCIVKHASGWNTKGLFYGIHLTTHRKFWSDAQLFKYAKFLNWKENQKFIWAIAQRAKGYGSTDYEYFAEYTNPKINNFFMLGHKTRIIEARYRVIVWLKNAGGEPLVETRLFQSTLNTESFLKNIEFVHALHTWITTDAVPTPHYTEFIKWLFRHGEAYPHLLSYLHRPKFTCKFAATFDNPFLETLQQAKQQATVWPEAAGMLVTNQPKQPPDEDAVDVYNLVPSPQSNTTEGMVRPSRPLQ